MRIRFFIPLALLGAVSLAAPAAAQDVDPQAALACSQAVDSQNWEQVASACPPVLAQLPEDHPYYASWTQSVNYAYGQVVCPSAGEAEDWDRVIATCEPALQVNSSAFIFNYFLGRAYASKQDWERTAVNFSSFLSGVRGNSQVAAQLANQVAFAQRVGGIAYARAGAANDAIPLLQAAAAANPTDIEVHFRLGRALLAVGQEAPAERALSVYIAEAPEPIPAIVFLAGQLSFNAGDHARAAERLNAFLAADPNARGAEEAHYMLALALQGSDPETALTHYESFLGGVAANDPRLPDVLFALGTLYYNKDDCSNAEQHYTRFLEMAPEHGNAGQVTEILQTIAEGGCEG